MIVARLVEPAFHAAFAKIASPEASLPVQTAFKLKKAAQKIEEAVKHFNEQRQAIVTKFAVRREDGEIDTKKDEASGQEIVQLDLATKEEWEKAFADLHSFEVELPQIPVALLGEKVELTVTDLFQLDGLIVE